MQADRGRAVPEASDAATQDVCHDSQLTRYEGHGYAYLAESFLPRLREAGVSDAEIETLTISNPRRILTIA